MTDAEAARETRRVVACLRHWQYRLGMLCQWTIEVEWKRGVQPSKADELKDRATVFSVSTDWEYQRAYLTCWLDQTVDCSDDALSSNVRHELVHVLVNEMREWHWYDRRTDTAAPYVAHEERVVSQIEKALGYLAGDDGQDRYPWPPPEWSPFDV